MDTRLDFPVCIEDSRGGKHWRFLCLRAAGPESDCPIAMISTGTILFQGHSWELQTHRARVQLTKRTKLTELCKVQENLESALAHLSTHNNSQQDASFMSGDPPSISASPPVCCEDDVVLGVTPAGSAP